MENIITAAGPQNLTDYDVIVVSSSAGKDSQVTLDRVVKLATELDILDRVVVVHADLGRVEWEGTKELARAQAEFYGVRFIVCSRIGGVAKKDSSVYKAGETYGDLLDYVERRGSWPDSKARYCTSEFKRGPIQKIFTALAKEWRSSTDEKRACRILDCQGLRAEESPARAKKSTFIRRKSTRTQHVDTWLPIHGYSTDDVWTVIKESGCPHHRAYDLGMSRLSCAFCVFANKRDLAISAEANSQLLDEYIAVEKRIDHLFKKDQPIANLKTKAAWTVPSPQQLGFELPAPCDDVDAWLDDEIAA